MESISLFRFAVHWLLALIRVGAWFWLMLLLLALSAWAAWTIHHLLLRAPLVFNRRHRRLTTHRQVPGSGDPALRLGYRR